MTKRMFTLLEVNKEAMYWYNSVDLDYCCLAENRLNRGEVPYAGF